MAIITNELQNYSKQFIKELGNGMFEISKVNNIDADIFTKYIITQKRKIVEEKVPFSLRNLALVRTMSIENFPRNLMYHTLQSVGKMANFDNPFSKFLEYIKYLEEFRNIDIGCNHSDIDVSKLKIQYPIFRNTKHFSLNGLASNVIVFYKPVAKFDNKEIIVIEPFEDHLGDNLVNLNPVDTFYNLEEKSFKIGQNAVFIIDTDTYKKLICDDTIRDDLSKVSVFLYASNNNDLSPFSGTTYQTIVTDIVLSYLGYIPQHSVDQCELVPEYCFDGTKFIDDVDYLKKFQDYIEKLNVTLLNQHYYCISRLQIEKRRTKDGTIMDFPGTLHSETDFAFQEDQANINSILYCLQKYLSLLVEDYELESDLAIRIFESYSKNIKANYGRNFSTEYHDLDIENEVIDYIKLIGYKNLVNATITFNNNQVKYEDTTKKDYSLKKSR